VSQRAARCILGAQGGSLVDNRAAAVVLSAAKRNYQGLWRGVVVVSFLLSLQSSEALELTQPTARQEKDCRRGAPSYEAEDITGLGAKPAASGA